jgi:hypothetical protein
LTPTVNFINILHMAIAKIVVRHLLHALYHAGFSKCTRHEQDQQMMTKK